MAQGIAHYPLPFLMLAAKDNRPEVANELIMHFVYCEAACSQKAHADATEGGSCSNLRF